MKFRKALALLLVACLLLSTAVVALSAPATTTYYSFEQHYNNTALAGSSTFAISGFSVDAANSRLRYEKGENTTPGRVIINTDSGLVKDRTYRVTFDLDVTTAATNTGWQEFFLASCTTSDNAHATDFSDEGKLFAPNNQAVNFFEKLKTVGKHTCSVTVVAKKPTVCFTLSSTNAVFSIDKVTIQEVFDLSVTVNDTNGGTAKVQNANTNLTGFTVGDYACFVAEPADDYVFAGWYDGENKVSSLAVYQPETAVTAPYTLQARFTLGQSEPVKITYGFEDDRYDTVDSGYTYSMDSDKHSGTYALKHDATGTKSFFITPKTEDYKLKKGCSYRVSFWAKVDKGYLWGVNLMSFHQNWLPNDGNYFSSGGGINSTTYQQYSVNIVAEEDGWLALRFYSQGGATLLWLDDIEISQLVTLTFDPQNGETATSLPGVYGEAITFPQDPKNTDWAFTGWFTDSDCKNAFTATTFPAKNTTLYAGWKAAKQVTVTFETNGGSAVAPLTGSAGSPMTVTTPTKEGFYFSGWFKDSAFTEGYTEKVFPAENTKLYARYTQNGTLTQGFENFENSMDSDIFSIYTAENAQDPYVAEGKHSLKANLNNKTGNVMLTDSYAKLTKGNAYRISFKVLVTRIGETANGVKSVPGICISTVADSANPWASGWLENREILGYANESNLNKWVEYSMVFIAKEEYYLCTLWGNTTLYVDDFKLETVKMVTVHFETSGGTELADLTGPAGAAMTVTSPTKDNKDFAGWFTDEACNYRYNAAYFPEENSTLYAKWIEKGAFEQDFEAWDLTGSSGERMSLYTATSADDPYVYSGTHSVYFKNNAMKENKILNLWDSSMSELVLGEKYRLSFKVKLVSTTNTKWSEDGISFQLWNTTQRENGWAEAAVGGRGAVLHYNALAFYEFPVISEGAYTNTMNQSYTTFSGDEKGWVTVSYEFTAVSKYLSILFSGGPCSLYVDCVTITPFPTGIYERNFSSPYCEDFYNELGGTGAIEAMNAGTKKIVELSLEKRGDYIFSASLKQGANAYLAWDAAGQNPIAGTTLTGSGSVTEMQALRFVTDQTGKVYFVTNGSGQNCCDYLAVFLTKYAKEKDPELRYAYYESDDSNTPVLTAEQFTAEDVVISGQSSEQSGSPATGETTALLPIMLMLFAATGTVLATKRGKKHEN